MRIEVLHAAVPGRLRLRVDSLYRSPVVALRWRRLSRELADVNVERIDLRRGSVLIRFPADMSSAALIATLGTALGEELRPIGPPPTRHHRAPPGREARGATATASTVAWHTLSDAEVVTRLDANTVSGLTPNQVAQRLARFGPNIIATTAARSDLALLLKQLTTVPVAMLGIAAGIAMLTGGIVDAIVILGVVVVNAAIGYVTETQAEQTISALSDTETFPAEVIRNAEQRTIRCEQLVPGDLVVLSPGGQIGADARLLQAQHLTVDESALTGESLPVGKQAEVVLGCDIALGDRRNCVYMGTMVSGGNGLAIVTTTGGSTEIGRVQSLVELASAPQTPLELELGQLGTQLGLLSGAVCAGVFLLGLLRGQPLLTMLYSAVSLAVAAVPEGLPTVATTTLALGVREMRRHRVAVRKLEAIESLGALQVLCLDKTGTLTANHMAAVELRQQGNTLRLPQDRHDATDRTALEMLQQDAYWLMLLVALCNDTCLNHQGGTQALEGSPTEVALLELAINGGLDVDRLRRRYARVEVRRRAEARPLMSTVHRYGVQWLLAVKGNPAEVLRRCDRIRQPDNQIVALDEAAREDILGQNEQMASRSLRVLAVAYRFAEQRREVAAEGLVWVGLVGLEDPLRQGMTELMRCYHRAGVRTVMITGDQSATAYAIGQQLGLGRNGHLEILDSARLDRLAPELLAALVGKVDVFARVSPAHKLRIVQALQRAGYVVAMTGDGINDGPALKAADVGVAMGAGGSNVARAVSDVVIEDDNLHTVVDAVRQGRAIYNNIRKAVHYLLSTNFSEIEVMFGALALGLGQPLTPMQLLWINLVSDVFPGLALSLEPPSEDLMRIPPRPTDEPIITTRRLGGMAFESALMSVGSLGAYLYGRHTGGARHGSTLCFHSLTTAQLLHAIACRSERDGLFNPHGRAGNRWLDLALGGTTGLQVLAASLAPARRLLGTTALQPSDLLVILGAAALPLLINEALKLRSTTPAVASASPQSKGSAT